MSSAAMPPLERVDPDLQLCNALGDAGDAVALRMWQLLADISSELKPDGSIVCDADVAVESAIRGILCDAHSNDSVLGEELGHAPGTSNRRWIIDGIDGTINYVARGRQWRIMIALEIDSALCMGMISSPALERRWVAAAGFGTWLRTQTDQVSRYDRVAVSQVDELVAARCTVLPPIEHLDGKPLETAQRLITHCREYVSPRSHPATMVACGEVELCLQLGGQLWDYAAPSIIVNEAGGSVTDLSAKPRIDHGGPLLFSNELLHADALRVLASGL